MEALLHGTSSGVPASDSRPCVFAVLTCILSPETAPSQITPHCIDAFTDTVRDRRAPTDQLSARRVESPSDRIDQLLLARIARLPFGAGPRAQRHDHPIA